MIPNVVVPPQPKPEKKNIFEKAQVIHAIQTKVGKQCKHKLECFSYDCTFEHATVTGYSKAAEEVLEKVRQFNIKKSKEEENKAPNIVASGQPKPQGMIKKQEAKIDQANKKIDALQKMMEKLTIGKETANVEIPEEMKCGICFEVMAVPTALAPCMHTFCKKCIDQWTTRADTCPFCKTKVQMKNKNILVE